MANHIKLVSPEGHLCKTCNEIKPLTDGINLDDAKAMLASQGGRCANKGCGVELNFNEKKGTRNRANIDHCHSTGAVRGILCLTCNTALGLIEQKNRMFGLTEYLDKYTKNTRS